MNTMNMHDLLSLASREYILGTATVDEQMGFIKDQINDPFDSGNTNYFKKLKKMVDNQDQLDEYCKKILEMIEDRYPNIEFNIDDYDRHLADFTDAVYKFFVRNIRKITYIYLREYIFNNKNRKGLLAEYQNTKLPCYPKEQYGKKENYMLITKLHSIIDDIAEMDIRVDKMITLVNRVSDPPLYLDFINGYLEQGLIYDHGIYSNIMELFDESDSKDSILNKLEMAITDAIITPYLQDNSMMEIRYVITDPEDDDSDISDDNDTSDEEDE